MFFLSFLFFFSFLSFLCFFSFLSFFSVLSSFLGFIFSIFSFFNFLNFDNDALLAFSIKYSITFSPSLSPPYTSNFILSSPKNKSVGNPGILYFAANSFCSSQFTAPILNKPFVAFAMFSNSGWNCWQCTHHGA